MENAAERIAVEYPIGHRRRRQDGIPLLIAKFEKNLFGRIPPPSRDENPRVMPESRIAGVDSREPIHGSVRRLNADPKAHVVPLIARKASTKIDLRHRAICIINRYQTEVVTREAIDNGNRLVTGS